MKKELIIVIIIVIAIIILDTITHNYTKINFAKINEQLEQIKEISEEIYIMEKEQEVYSYREGITLCVIVSHE